MYVCQWPPKYEGGTLSNIPAMFLLCGLWTFRFLTSHLTSHLFAHLTSLFKYQYFFDVFCDPLVLNTSAFLPNLEFSVLCLEYFSDKFLSRNDFFYSKNFISIYNCLFCFQNSTYWREKYFDFNESHFVIFCLFYSFYSCIKKIPHELNCLDPFVKIIWSYMHRSIFYTIVFYW